MTAHDSGVASTGRWAWRCRLSFAAVSRRPADSALPLVERRWRLNGAMCTEKAVKERMVSLNIQVDNPLQFLPQDKVGQFSNMSPIELLKHTEMAIGPDTYKQHFELIEADKDLSEVEQRRANEQASVAARGPKAGAGRCTRASRALALAPGCSRRWSSHQPSLIFFHLLQISPIFSRFLPSSRALCPS